MNEPRETHPTSVPAVRKSIHANLVEQGMQLQREFDALATQHDGAGQLQISLRAEMLALLSGMDVRLTEVMALTENEEPSDAARIGELQETNIDALQKFDRAALSYADQRHQDRLRGYRLRDALAKILKTRAEIQSVGGQLPDVIQHAHTARQLDASARIAAGLPARTSI